MRRASRTVNGGAQQSTPPDHLDRPRWEPLDWFAVAYDEKLADRIRELIGGEPRLTEQKMFGGLAFLVDGNMAIAASGQGGALVRVDPATGDELVATTAAEPMEMRGRSMTGWLRVDAEHLTTKRQLAKWVDLGTAYARSLPVKKPKKRK